MPIGTSHLAHFTVQGIERAGALTIDGRKSKIEVYADDLLHLTTKETTCLQGVSKDGVSISAIHCVGAESDGHSMYHGKTRHFLSLFPNLVVMGPRHVDPEQDNITSLSFSFSEANELFYDLGTFGQISWKRRLSFGQLRDILRNARRSPKHRRRGGILDIYYAWDRGPIMEFACAFGSVRVWNETVSHSPSPTGLAVHNRVQITCAFSTPRNIETALKTLYTVMPFFELVSQSAQNIEDVKLVHIDAQQLETPLSLYVSNDDRQPVEGLMTTDALVSGGLQTEEFKITLQRWIDTTPERRVARHRFIQGFRRGYKYEIDRLIGAANSFDLLPADDFAKATALPLEVESLLSSLESQVKVSAKASAAVNAYKERTLNMLGLVRGLNLRTKILLRYATLSPAISSHLPGMEEIIAHSVQARNFFVHGTQTKFSSSTLYDLVPFFTDTLEFVFATTELQFCGWDAPRWSKQHFSHSRLKWYIRTFEENKARVVSEQTPPKGH